MAEAEVMVSEDGRLARLRVGEEVLMLDAAAVEALAWRLAACRAAMAPRRTAFMFAGSRLHLGEAIVETTDGEGRPAVAILHPGLGWVAAVIRPSRRKPRPASQAEAQAARQRCP